MVITDIVFSGFKVCQLLKINLYFLKLLHEHRKEIKEGLDWYTLIKIHPYTVRKRSI